MAHLSTATRRTLSVQSGRSFSSVASSTASLARLRTRPPITHSTARPHARSFFGIGEILGVITNPSEVLRSLSESRKLLEEARQEMQEQSEKKQIPVSHTFSPLPGWYPRKAETRALEKALAGIPMFTVMFGASSVGKTALLRQVLSSPAYHVLHFDLRIAGFADLQSLYFSLALQLEGWFHALPEIMGPGWGWEEFEKESWAFKHDRLTIERRLEAGGAVKTSDISHLLELFQSALLKYWEFEPMTDSQRKDKKKADETMAKEKPEEAHKRKHNRTDNSDHLGTYQPRQGIAADVTQAKMRDALVGPKADKEAKAAEESLIEARSVKAKEAKEADKEAKEGEEAEPVPPPKKIPVFFIDEAHKLPALIQADDAMKALLDAMLVLTKQDRLCHVVHSTSDAFYWQWLRQTNTAQHCHLLTIGDATKAEAEEYFNSHLLPHVPEPQQKFLDFAELYRIFGGKLAHLSDYVAEYINADGEMTPLSSSHFLQAYALANLQLLHSLPNKNGDAPAGFEIYSAIKPASPHSAPAPEQEAPPPVEASFTSQDLLTVMRRLQSPPPPSPHAHKHPLSAKESLKPPRPVESLPYFGLCRELGVKAVDGLVRARLLELRWSRTVSKEGEGRRRALDDGDVEMERGPRLHSISPVMSTAMRYVLHEWEGELRVEQLEGRETEAGESRRERAEREAEVGGVAEEGKGAPAHHVHDQGPGQQADA